MAEPFIVDGEVLELLHELYRYHADLDRLDNGGARPPPTKEERVETRKRKHRESMARLRAGRRDSLTALEIQAQALHRQLVGKLLERKQGLLCCDPGSGAGGGGGGEARPAVHQRTPRYEDLIEEAESLRNEKRALENLLHLRERFGRLVHVESQRMEQEDKQHQQPSYPVMSTTPTLTAAAAAAPTLPTGYWFQYVESESPFFYDCETLASTALIIQAGLASVRHTQHLLSTKDTTNSTPPPVHCLGWQTERKLVYDAGTKTSTLLFRFSRRVSRLRTSLDELLDKTWAIHNSTQLMARMYGAAMVSKVVQRLDDETIVMLRNAPTNTKTEPKTARHFTVAARLTTANGESAMMLHVPIDKQPTQERLDRRHPPDKNNSSASNKIVWIKGGSGCLQFTNLSDEVVEIAFVGSMECGNSDDTQANRVLVAICGTLLRWEHLVVPPRLLAS